MMTILKEIEQLAADPPHSYSEKEKLAYRAACNTVKEIILKSINPVSIRRSEVKKVKIRVDIDGRMALRRRSDKRHPIRLNITYNRQIKRYAISKFKDLISSNYHELFFHKNEWKNLWGQDTDPIKEDLENLEQKIADIIKNKVQPFSFPKFEKTMGFKSSST